MRNLNICIEGPNGVGKTTLANRLLEEFSKLAEDIFVTRRKENKSEAEIEYRRKLKEFNISEQEKRLVSIKYATEMLLRVKSASEQGKHTIIDKCPVVNSSVYNASMFHSDLPINLLLDMIKNDEIFNIPRSFNIPDYDLVVAIIPPVFKVRQNIINKHDKDDFDDPDNPIEIIATELFRRYFDYKITSGATNVLLIDDSLSIEDTVSKVWTRILELIKAY